MTTIKKDTFVVNHVTYLGTEDMTRRVYENTLINHGQSFEDWVVDNVQKADMETIRNEEFERQEKEMDDYFREPSPAVKEFAQALSKFVNGSSSREIDDVLREFFKDHRTLQQNSIRLFLAIIEAMANREPGKHLDARNDDSQLVCSQLIEGFQRVRAEYDTKKFGRPTNDKALPSQYLRYI